MRIVKNLSQIFEAVKGQSFKIGAPKVAPNIKTIVQWPFEYFWPRKQATLGTTEEMINFINAATEGDASTIMADIKKSANAIVGISREEENAENNKLFGTDTQSVKGWVYLFKPNTIDETKVPDEKKLEPKVNGLFTFVVDSQLKNYSKTQSAQTNTGNAGSGTANAKRSVGVFDLTSSGSAHNKWLEGDKGPMLEFITPTYRIIQKFPPAGLNEESATTSVFWVLVNALPDDDIKTTATAEKTQAQPIKYDTELKAAISKVISVAKGYDPNQFTGVNIDQLSAELYSKLAYAILVIGINRKAIDINFTAASGHTSSETYYKSLRAALQQAGNISGIATSASQPAGSSSSTFDGSSIKTEDQLLQILAGAIADNPAAFGNPDPSKYNTVATTKTLFAANMGGHGYDNLIKALKKYSSFDHGKSYPKSDGFKDFENTINSTTTGNFDDALLARIKTLISKSPIK